VAVNLLLTFQWYILSMTKTILISGGSGKFATHLKSLATDFKVIAPTHDEMNITSIQAVEIFVNRYEPDYFIHAAALTRPLSIHQERPQSSILINIIGTSNVVMACMKTNTKLIYISTDYVYAGSAGNYTEESELKPFNNYGWSKLGGECAVQMYDNSLILRTAMNNKPFNHPKALVDLRKSLVYDIEAAEITLKLLDKFGIVNVGGVARTVYEFVKETNAAIKPITLSEISDIPMPNDITLNIDKLSEFLLSS
jgi:dTDP-4-dehydrorhamnose reductase